MYLFGNISPQKFIDKNSELQYMILFYFLIQSSHIY